jgi:hypothetical protein
MQIYPATSRIFSQKRPKSASVFTAPDARDALKLEGVDYLAPEDPSDSMTSAEPELLKTNMPGFVSYDEGFTPSINNPGSIYPMDMAEPYPATVSANVENDDTTVTVTLKEDGSTQDATLLLPNGLDVQDCVPQWVSGDEIMVFKTRDKQWFAGPLISKEAIKEIFECPA